MLFHAWRPENSPYDECLFYLLAQVQFLQCGFVGLEREPIKREKRHYRVQWCQLELLVHSLALGYG